MNGDCGAIAIHGGTVKAQGGSYGAGIGGGTASKGGSVTITGGRIYSRAGVEGDPDIGDGRSAATPCTVSISGGIFARKPQDAWLATARSVVPNTDAATADDYPWWVVEASSVVRPGCPLLYESAAAATNAAKKAVFAPSEEVAAKLGSGEAKAKYRNMFTLDVVPTSDGKYAVEATLYPEDRTNVIESVQSATRQIPLADIAALDLGVETNLTAKGCGVPGFYYSFYTGIAVTNLRALANEKGRNILCGPNKDVKFEGVAKPSEEAGFFTIGVKDTDGVQPSDMAPHSLIALPVFDPEIR